MLFGVRGTGVWGECLLGTGQTHLVRALVQRPYKLNPTVIVVPQMSRLKPLSDQACLIGVEGAR